MRRCSSAAVSRVRAISLMQQRAARITRCTRAHTHTHNITLRPSTLQGGRPPDRTGQGAGPPGRGSALAHPRAHEDDSHARPGQRIRRTDACRTPTHIHGHTEPPYAAAGLPTITQDQGASHRVSKGRGLQMQFRGVVRHPQTLLASPAGPGMQHMHASACTLLGQTSNDNTLLFHALTQRQCRRKALKKRRSPAGTSGCRKD